MITSKAVCSVDLMILLMSTSLGKVIAMVLYTVYWSPSRQWQFGWGSGNWHRDLDYQFLLETFYFYDNDYSILIMKINGFHSLWYFHICKCFFQLPYPPSFYSAFPFHGPSLSGYFFCCSVFTCKRKHDHLFFWVRLPSFNMTLFPPIFYKPHDFIFSYLIV